jgi:hypothetical protein
VTRSFRTSWISSIRICPILSKFTDMRPRLTTLNIWFALSVLSLIVNFAAQWRSEHAVNFWSEAARVSWALQHHRGFSDPYLSGPSGPTAQMAPAYPLLHAAACLVFGTGAAGWAAILALTALVWSLQWTLAYDFLRYYGRPNAGLGAALFGVLLPLPGRLFKWEAVFTACALAAGACLMARLLTKPDRAKASLLGVAAAASVLLTPATTTVFFAWGVFLLRHRPLKSAVNILATALVCAMLPLGLWTARNYRTFGHLFFIRDDIGITIGSSNSDCTQAILADNLASGCTATVHPSSNLTILSRLRQQGEYQFAARQMATTVQWVRSHPARFATLTLERIAYFWFPLERTDKWALMNGVVMSLTTVLSFLSVLWRRSPGFAILAAGLSFYPISYYLVQGEQRYRYPVFWMSVLLAAVGVELILGRRAET